MEPQNRRVNLRGIIIKDGKLFCQKLKLSDGRTADYWCTPGGGIDFGESLHEGLKREMIEETGVAPHIGRLLAVQQFHDGQKEQLEFFFHITNADDYETLDLCATTHGLEEVAECGFIDPKNNIVKPDFLTKVDLEKLVNNPAPVMIETEL